MLKFFRKIRHRLLSEGKTVSYIKYAFGEIFLVMIGILLALQVNTWREQVKRNEKELNTVKLLIRDLKSEYNSMAYFTSRLDQQNAATIRFLESLEQNQPDTLLANIYSTLNIWNYRPKYPVFMGLKENGNLDLIADPEVREQVIIYHNSSVTYLDDIRESYKLSVLEARKATDKYLIRSWSDKDSTWVRNKVYDFEEMRQDKELMAKVALTGDRRHFFSQRLSTLFMPENDSLTTALINYEKQITK